MTWDKILNFTLQLTSNALTTHQLFFMTLLFALPLGLLTAVIRMSCIRPVSYIMRGYLLVMRGTPLMLQLIFFMYGVKPAIENLLFNAFGASVTFSRLQVAIFSFTLNYAAYFAEIYRGGIESIPAGQREAANVLGFSKKQTFFRIILPQVVRKILPPMGNEFMTLVKDTALARIIGVVEITSYAEKMQAFYVSVLPVVIAGIFYLLMNAVVSRCFAAAEKRLGYYS